MARTLMRVRGGGRRGTACARGRQRAPAVIGGDGDGGREEGREGVVPRRHRACVQRRVAPLSQRARVRVIFMGCNESKVRARAVARLSGPAAARAHAVTRRAQTGRATDAPIPALVETRNRW